MAFTVHTSACSLVIPDNAPAYTPDDVYYDAYKHGYLAGELDSILENPEGNGLTCFTTSPYIINLDAWEEAQRWGYQDGLDGSERRSKECVIMHLDNDFAI